jgi:hypothetical protein
MQRAAGAALDALGDALDAAYARAVALALAPRVKLIVLERPPPGAFERIGVLQAACALLQTCVSGERVPLPASALEGSVE